MAECGTGMELNLTGTLPKSNFSNNISPSFTNNTTTTRVIAALGVGSKLTGNYGIGTVTGVLNANDFTARVMKISSLQISASTNISGLKLKIERPKPDGTFLQVGDDVNVDSYNTMCANQTNKYTIPTANIILFQNDRLSLTGTNGSSPSEDVSVFANFELKR